MTREALKLALEALEASHFLIHGSETKGGLAFCMDGYYSGCFDIDSNDKQTNEAITAIKEALAQPEQEPVAWMNDSTPSGIFARHMEGAKNFGCTIPLYTTPPQRTWVGLTKEERHEISMANRPYCADVMAAHEEELKRRNT